MCFKGRTAMITGGASGMGLLSGKKLAEAGANVVLCDVNEEMLNAAAEEVRASGGSVLPLVVDFILYLCSDKAAFITGSSHVIDGGHLLV